MVLSHVKNFNDSDDSNNKGIFVQSSICDADGHFTLTVLLPKEAFIGEVSPNSSFISTWSKRLKISKEVYMQQLISALHDQQKDCDSDDNPANKKPKTTNNDCMRHVFQVENNNTLKWKQYFPEQKIYGNRGVIPLKEAEYSTVVWELLQEASNLHHTSQQQVFQLQHQNSELKQEVAKAVSLADGSERAKKLFQKQSIAKFCALLNAKKKRIKQLLEAVQSPSSGTASNNRSHPGDCNISVGETSGNNSLRPAPNVSDEDFDDDTDVDDPVECDDGDTDDEKERLLEKTPITKHNENHADVSKKRGVSSTSEDAAPSKRFAIGDSQDDLFNTSMEGSAMAMLSNIKPRTVHESK